MLPFADIAGQYSFLEAQLAEARDLVSKIAQLQSPRIGADAELPTEWLAALEVRLEIVLGLE